MTTNSNSIDSKVQDQKDKLDLLIKHLLPHCHGESEHEDFRKIGHVLRHNLRTDATSTTLDSRPSHNEIDNRKENENHHNDEEYYELVGDILSGGATNYSYRIYLTKKRRDGGSNNNQRKSDSQPEEKLPSTSSPTFIPTSDGVVLFAKVCFSYALWSSDRSKQMDLGRQNCEYAALQHFEHALRIQENDNQPIVPKPYVVLDLAPHTRALVTQWCPSADTPWAQQFAQGCVDRRIVPKVAKALAIINTTPHSDDEICHSDQAQEQKEEKEDSSSRLFMSTFPTSFNQKLKDFMFGLNSNREKLYDIMLFNENEPPKDECIRYLQQDLGRDRFLEAVQNMQVAMQRTDCLLHGDFHVFNILVEAQPPLYESSNNDNDNNDDQSKGRVYLCDWEFAHVGPHGRDIGTLQSFPLLCAYLFAVRGELDKALGILACLQELWASYSGLLSDGCNKGGAKANSHMMEVFRASLGFNGSVAFFLYYLFRAHLEHIDTTGLTTGQVDQVITKVGMLGIHLLEQAFLDPIDTNKQDRPDTEPRTSRNAASKDLPTWYYDRIHCDLNSLSGITT